MDKLIHQKPITEADSCAIEILVHFIDVDGNRISPSCNRIKLPLQVSEITDYEKNNFPRVLLSSICDCFRDREFLHRLVRVAGRAEKSEELNSNTDHKLLELALFPILDSVEITEK